MIQTESEAAAANRETGDTHRLDAGKDAGFWLIPRRPLILLAQLYAIGAAKYAPRGWEAGMAWSRIVDPLFRHLLKWLTGEKYDPVDGQHHLAAVAWACFALMEYETTHPELDDLAREQIGQAVTVHDEAWANAVANADPASGNRPANTHHTGPASLLTDFGGERNMLGD